MDKQFEKRLERAMNPRVRKRNVKRPEKFERPSSHVASVLEELQSAPEVSRKGMQIYELPFPSRAAPMRVVTEPAKAVVAVACAAVMDGVEAVKKRLGKKERMQKLERRRSYYAAEAAKRAEQREQIRAAQVAPTNPCPTPEALTDAYLHRGDSEECQLRFGELMIDLEEHARREFAFTGGKFTTSSGGVKDWLKVNCPLLAQHYSTCQRYKRLAQEDSATYVNG